MNTRSGERPIPLSVLDGLRVVDLSRALSGPFCSLILADLGADVVKVEPIDGDMIRKWAPFDGDESVYYLSANRNKQSIAVDFRTEAGRDIIATLIASADVVIENFKSGTMSAMGFDPEQLRSQYPSLVIARVGGYGPSGPLRSHPAFDQVAQGYSGLMSVTGEPESGPTRVGVAIGDLTAGMWLAIGVLTACLRRDRTGMGGIVETSLLESLVGLLSIQGQRYLSLGDIPGPVGNQHPAIAPYGCFAAADGWLNIAAGTQQMFVNLCGVLGVPELVDDPRFRTNSTRVTHREALKELVEDRLTTRSRGEWIAELEAAEVPVGPINDMADVFASEQVRSLGLLEEFDHPTLGTMRQVLSPVRLDGAVRRREASPPPLLGEHTVVVLEGLGYSSTRIDALIADGVVRGAAGPTARSDARKHG